MLNWIAWNGTVFLILKLQLCLTELFEIELFDNARALENEEYLFIVIAPRSTQTRNGST